MAVSAPHHALVIGGGIAGLAAAYTLERQAREVNLPLRLTLLERDHRWGGKILTERTDGFVIEAGPDAFVSTKPWALDLCRELGIAERLQRANADRRKVYSLHGGQLIELPDGLVRMVPSRIGPMLRTPLLSPRGKLRLGLDLLLPARRADGDESLARFVTRRLGREAYAWLIEPLLSGIYAGDGHRLSLRSTFPYLREWEQRHGSLIRAALAAVRARSTSHPDGNAQSVFLTPKAGLAEIVEALLDRLRKADLRHGVDALALLRTAAGYRVDTGDGTKVEADIVILAAPAFDAARLLRGLDPELARLLDAIEYVSTATVSLAFQEADIPRPLDGHGYVIPRAEGRMALACTWTSTKFPHRAPPGKVLLRVFIGRAGQEIEGSEASLVDIARRELADTLGIHAEPVLARAYRWPRAMPQYNLGHSERLAAIQTQVESLPGIFLAGAAYAGIGIPDCIHSGQQAARRAFAFVQRRVTMPSAVEA